MEKKETAERVSPTNRPVRFLLLVFMSLNIALFAVSCAGNPKAASSERPVPPASSSDSPKASVASPLSVLSPPAQAFLSELQDHIRKGDWAWSAERADPSFLRAMEGQARDAYFYTYLFSAGTLSLATSDESKRFEIIPLAKVRSIVWDEVSVEGPVAIVNGRFLLSQGAAFPFTLRLLWRLEPPRILGEQP